MRLHLRLVRHLSVLAVATVCAASVVAQSPSQVPLRFTAFGVSMQAGVSGTIDIVIERWTTDAEREPLVALLGQTSFKLGGQRALLEALQKVEPRAGYIRTPQSMGWDLKYAREFKQPDGTRQIVIATDKPVSFLAASRSAPTMEYPFTFIELRMKPDGTGEGRLLAATAVAVQNGELQLENYGQEPVRLTSVKQASGRQ